MKVTFDLFKDGRKRALTFSYDDGHIHDRRLVGIFNEYGMHGTFHLNSQWHIDRGDWVIPPEEIKTLYAGHEVSCHLPTHPHATRIPQAALVSEIMDDRRNLESLCGCVVRGMSYPYGSFSREAIDVLSHCGVEYSRTTRSTGWFAPPDDFMEWDPTCHHSDPKLYELFDRFCEDSPYQPLKVMEVWGHSFEFDRNGNWDLIEDFCKYASGRDDIWYATNIEICDYINAMRKLRVSADGYIFYNPGAVDIWVTSDGRPVKIAAGTTVDFRKDNN